MSPEDMNELLTVRRVVIEPAPQEVLQQRLDARLREKELRLRRYRHWPANISERWLQEEIEVLEQELKRLSLKD
jgi:hypothetical protein